MNKNIRNLGVLASLLGILPFTGCSKNKPSSETDAIKFVDNSNGKKLVLFNQYETNVGAFGVKIGYDDIDNVSSLMSTNYSSVIEDNGKYVCVATVTTPAGSVFSTTDTIYMSGKHVRIDRKFKVISASSVDLGFSTYYSIENIDPVSVYDYEWFCPGNYYGNDEWGFTGVGVKTAFPIEVSSYIDSSVVMNDNSGTPLIMNYAKNKAFALLDLSGGYRETMATDYGIRDSKILYDERFNIGGVGIRGIEENGVKHAQLFQNYPSYTANFCGCYLAEQYRMLPVIEGLEREQSLDFSFGEFDSFFEASRTNWRYSYDYYSVIDKRYSAEDVYKATYVNIGNSFGYIAGVPQYMCNSDHAIPDGGFLYRNSELACLMLNIGRKINNQKYIDDALTVIKNQIEFDRLDAGLVASQEDLYTYRTSNDALFNLCIDYQTELDLGYEHPEWISYLLKKANKKLSSTYWVDAMFLSQFAKLTGCKTYQIKAIELMNTIKEEHKKMHFYGTISNPAGHRILEKEGGLISLCAYLNLYELTQDKEWLELAERAAFHAETYQQIQPICIDSYDNPGFGSDFFSGKTFNQGFMGNSRFLAYGISYVCSQVCSGDNGNAFDTSEFYRLYKYTNDAHYKSFYEYIIYNSTLYVNMGDKVGYLDDMLYSSGYGFQNEYFGLSNTDDPASFRRGTLHDSNLAWNMYAVLQSYVRIANMLNDGRIVDCDDANRDYDLLKNRYALKQHDCYIVDLNEFCHVSSIIGYSETVSYSIDGTIWEEKNHDFVANFIKLPLSVDIKNIKIMGVPMTYRALNYDTEASVNPSSFSAAMDWNYSTKAAFAKSASYLIDLGAKRTISHIAAYLCTTQALSFSIEVSEDGISFDEYKNFVDASLFLHVAEKKVSNIQFIRITNNSSRQLACAEFKVMGI